MNASMIITKRTGQLIALCLLLIVTNMVRADELQDANKYFKQGQHALALEKVESFLKSKPKDAQARFLKGLILTEQGKATEAIKVFSALTDDYPELPEPYNNLAVLFAGQGQYEKAKVALEMAIRTHPSYATAHENLGDIYAKMASQAYDRALQLDRSNTSTQTKLEMIKDLFGGNRGGRTNVASQNAVTVIVSPNKPATPPVAPPAVKPNVVVALPSASKPAVVVPPPTVEKPPVAAKPAATNNTDEEVAHALHDWAAAWSAKNVKKYLSFYAKEFKAPDGLSRNAWEAQRQERINKPKSIQVAVSEIKVTKLDATHVNVAFRQGYQASHMHTSTVKTIRMVKTGGRWQIADEHVGK
jgi:tetratricopeptide (TPR) repeat protein